MSGLWLLSVFALSFISKFTDAVECHACLSYCKILPDGKLDMENCDCTGDQTCSAENCFTKVELFNAESIAIVQKGCADNQPAGPTGCHYAGQPESIHCYCDSDKCNTRRNLNDYSPQKLPVVECCECSAPSGEKCPEEKCARTCRGNYCLIDFDGLEQGCGVGLPRLKNFLRIQNYSDLQGTATCARYLATQSTVVHGCVCTSPTGHCNQVNESRAYQAEKVVARRVADQHYCYSLHQKSKKAFTQDIFRKSETCQGHYCFISMTSSELAVENESEENQTAVHSTFVGVARPRYEILAGCVQVDDDRKVSSGCTTEFSVNSSEPISRHCICDSHLCNYFNLLTDDSNGNGRQVLLDRSHDHEDVQPTDESTLIQPSSEPAASPTENGVMSQHTKFAFGNLILAVALLS